MEIYMAEWRKGGATTEAKADSDRNVRDTVEGVRRVRDSDTCTSLDSWNRNGAVGA
jgi:hypothetical protein